MERIFHHCTALPTAKVVKIFSNVAAYKTGTKGSFGMFLSPNFLWEL